VGTLRVGPLSDATPTIPIVISPHNPKVVEGLLTIREVAETIVLLAHTTGRMVATGEAPWPGRAADEFHATVRANLRKLHAALDGLP
jgi:hypothetical protein